jgi:hypothetical protein
MTDEPSYNQENKPHPAEAPKKESDPSVWPLVAVVVGIVVILAVVLLPVKTKTDNKDTGVRSLVASVKANQRAMSIPIASYWLDHNAYPACVIGDGGANGFLPPESPSYQIPTFQVQNAHHGTGRLHTLTTPLSYVTTYFQDPFAPQRGASFAYWTDDSGKGWLVWSAGPDSDYDIDPGVDYRPGVEPFPSDLLINHTYDPTNGTTSGGDIWRVKD